MDFSQYRDIAPYRGRDVEDAVSRVIANGPAIEQVLCGVRGRSGEFDRATTDMYINQVIEQLGKVHTYTDFQKYVTAGIFIPSILRNSSTGFTYSGLENIRSDEAYFFMSNHRDIILDCALIDYALLLSGKQMCEMAIGDNLLYNQFIKDLFKLNGGVTVRRELPLREKYLESIRLSRYFVEIILEEKRSIWCAQKSGRAKDGIDATNPAIIKMLYLSQRHCPITFPDLMRKCRLVPVAVSYENDPNDISKGREEADVREKGFHTKKRYEDLISMIRGLKRQKGHIHVAFGAPIVDDCDDPRSVAAQIDRQIHLNYHLYANNYWAYDYLEKSDRFASQCRDFDSDAFMARYRSLRPTVRNLVLQSFANPVRSYVSAKDRA